VTLAMFGRCEQSGYNLATIWPTIQLIITIKQGLSSEGLRSKKYTYFCIVVEVGGWLKFV
jgi:hypothetical protein